MRHGGAPCTAISAALRTACISAMTCVVEPSAPEPRLPNDAAPERAALLNDANAAAPSLPRACKPWRTTSAFSSVSRIFTSPELLAMTLFLFGNESAHKGRLGGDEQAPSKVAIEALRQRGQRLAKIKPVHAA